MILIAFWMEIADGAIIASIFFGWGVVAEIRVRTIRAAAGERPSAGPA